MRPGTTIALLLAGLLAWVIPSAASPTEEEDNTDPRVSAYLSHAALPAGGSGTILFVVEVPAEFHIQMNDFLEAMTPEDSPITLGDAVITPNAEWDEEPVLKGTVPIRVPFTVQEDASPGEVRVPVSLGFQGCSEGPIYACFPPDEKSFSPSLRILPAGLAAEPANAELFAAHGGVLEAGGEAEEAAPAAEGGSLEERLKRALARGSLAAVLLVFLGGILASFTPCVYPMIPITISYVGGQARSRMHGFVMSLFFVLGIALMYAALGILAAGAGMGFGEWMKSPVAILVVAGIFTAMGASMLGAFDIVVPSTLTTRMTTASSSATTKSGGAFIGAVLMGMTTGLVASPCVGPVLIVLLAFVAEAGNLFLGFWLLFTFACGMGMLFLVLGTFAGALNALPGAGSWMDTVKHGFGVVLIAMAIYYVRGLLDPQAFRFILGIYLVLVGVFTGAFTPLAAEPTRGVLFRKAVGILIFLSGAVVFLLWLFAIAGVPLSGGLVAGGPGAGPAHAEPAWEVYSETRTGESDALAAAAEAGKPAIIDFWADWCAACKELDEKTWSDPEVYAEAERFVLIKMDGTEISDYKKETDDLYAVFGRPTVIFYDSEGNEAERFSGFKGPRDVLEIMRRVR